MQLLVTRGISAMHNIMQTRSKTQVNVHIKQQNEDKCDLCDFYCLMVVGVRWAALNISGTADFLVM